MSNLFSVRIQPGARHQSLEQLSDGSWKVCLRARAVEGKANAALCHQIADWLGVSRSAVTIARGEKSRQKFLKIVQLDEEEISERLKKVAS